MSTTSAQGQAPTSGAHPDGRHDRLGGVQLVAVVVALTVAVGLMLLAFAAPVVNSGAHGLPLAVSGPSPAIAQLKGALEQHHPGAFEFTSYATKDEAAQAIQDRETIGGIALGTGGTTIQTAAGAGTPYANLLRSIGAGLAASGQQISYAELAPTTSADPAGSGLAALGLPVVFGGMASAILLFLRGPRSRRARVLTILVFAVLAGLTASAILQFGFHAIDGSYWGFSLALALGIAAIAVTVSGLGALLGFAGIALGAILMLFVANPLSGLATGPQWLPQPWGEVGQFLPVGAAGTVLRSLAYFGGRGAGTAWVVLGVWALAGLAFTLIRRPGPAHSAPATSPGS